MNKRCNYRGKNVFFAVLSALAICLDLRVPGLTASQLSTKTAEILQNISISISADRIFATLLAAGLYFFYRETDKRKNDHGRIFILPVSLLVSCIWVMGKSFYLDNTLNALTCSAGQTVKSIIIFVGDAYFLYQLAHFLFHMLQAPCKKENDWSADRTFWKRLENAYRKKAFIFTFLVLFVLWLPHIVIAYPGYFCEDSYYQIAQYYALTPITSHHPPMSTLLMGSVIQLGSAISGNFGAYVYVLAQEILFAAILSYMFATMVQMEAPRWLLVGTLLCCVFVPYYPAYTGLFLKDCTYSYFFLLFMIELTCYMLDPEAYFQSKRHLVLWSVSSAGVFFMRNDGKYILLLSNAILIVRSVFVYAKREKAQKKRFAAASHIAALIVPFVLAWLIQAAVLDHYCIEKGSIREAFSFPFQQTARYVREYGDEITDEEKEIINKVLEYDAIASLYTPSISDPVKNTFKDEATSRDLLRYGIVWSKQFFKHPLVYLEATVNQNYYLFYTGVMNDTVYINWVDDGLDFFFEKPVDDLLGIHDVGFLVPLKRNIASYYDACFRFPGITLLSHPAIYVLLLICLLVFSIRKRYLRWIVLSVPAFCCLAVIILSPLIQGSPRYAFPIIYSMPILLAFYLRLSQAGPGAEKELAGSHTVR